MTDTSCNGAQFFGFWVMHLHYLDSYVTTAWAIVESGQLPEYQNRAAKQIEANNAAPPYTVDKDGIAELHLSGPLTKKETSFTTALGGTSMIRAAQGLRKAAADPSVKLTRIVADTPGGTHDGTAELCDVIARCDREKPVFVHAPDLCASGGMWAAAGARGLTLGPGASAGSIGVLTRLVDTSENTKKQGIRPLCITSDADYKAIGASGLPITEEHFNVIKNECLAKAAPFWNAISKFTGKPVETIKSWKGGLLVGQNAVDAGIADAVCSDEESLHRCRDYLNCTDAARKALVDRGRQDKSKLISFPINNPPAAPIAPPTPPAPLPAPGSTTMSLTESELALIRGVPGCAAITAENGVATLVRIAHQDHQIAAQYATLEQEHAAMKQKAWKPDVPTIALAATSAKMLAQSIAQQQILPPAVCTALVEQIVGTDAKDGQAADYNVEALKPGPDGSTLASKIFGTLLQTKNATPPIKIGDRSGVQRIPRNVPGKGGIATSVVGNSGGPQTETDMAREASAAVTRAFGASRGGSYSPFVTTGGVGGYVNGNGHANGDGGEGDE